MPRLLMIISYCWGRTELNLFFALPFTSDDPVIFPPCNQAWHVHSIIFRMRLLASCLLALTYILNKQLMLLNITHFPCMITEMSLLMFIYWTYKLLILNIITLPVCLPMCPCSRLLIFLTNKLLLLNITCSTCMLTQALTFSYFLFRFRKLTGQGVMNLRWIRMFFLSCSKILIWRMCVMMLIWLLQNPELISDTVK